MQKLIPVLVAIVVLCTQIGWAQNEYKPCQVFEYLRYAGESKTFGPFRGEFKVVDSKTIVARYSGQTLVLLKYRFEDDREGTTYFATASGNWDSGSSRHMYAVKVAR